MKAIGVQPCILCCLDRRFANAEAVTRDYEIQRLVCPSCESVIRLVQKRAATQPLREHLAPGALRNALDASSYRLHLNRKDGFPDQ